METSELEPIAIEFIGKKCILRLTNGIKITGTLGSIQQNARTNINELVLWCNNNIDKHIPLKEIDALREV